MEKKSRFNLGQARFEALNFRLNDVENSITKSRQKCNNRILVDLFFNVEMLCAEAIELMNKEQKTDIENALKKMRDNSINIHFKKIIINNNKNKKVVFSKFIDNCFIILKYIKSTLQENGAYFQMTQLITPRSKKAEMKEQYLSNMSVSKDLVEDDE